MMQKDPFIERYQQLLEAFHSYFRKTLENQDMEDLHQLRVTIKKLRALWSMAEWTTQGTWRRKEHLSLFSRLFEEAGKVREAQVNLSLVTLYRIYDLDEFRQYQTSIQEHASAELIEQMMAFNFHRFEALNDQLLHQMEGLSVTDCLNHAIAYVQEEMAKVQELGDTLPNDRNLHKIRIHLKAVAEILNLIHQWSDDDEWRVYREEIKALNEQLGIWHDHTVLLQSINEFAQTRASDTSLEALIVDIETANAIRQQAVEKSLTHNMAMTPC